MQTVCHALSELDYLISFTLYSLLLQVAVLAPLALLLVLEARCVHFVIAHFNYFVLWSSASLAPHIHVYMMTNL